MAKKIIKGKIGNAITSVAEDHIVVVSDDVFDEKHQKYQSEINDISMSGGYWNNTTKQVLFDRLKSNLAQCINDGTIYFVTDSNGNFTQIALGDGSKSHVVGIGPKMDDTTKQELMSKLGLTISSDMGTIQLGKLANHNGVSSQKVITYERTGLGTDIHEISTVGYVQQYMKNAQAMVYAGVFNAQTKEITDYNNAIIPPSEEGNVTFDYLLNGNEGEALLHPGMSFIVGTAGDLEGYTGISVYGGQTKVEVGDMIIIINVQQKEGDEGGSTYNEASILIIHNTNLDITEFESGIIYDVSSHNDGAVFKSLSALLSSSSLDTLIPTSVRHGGMSIRFIQGTEQSSNNKYVQYRLMSNTFNTTPANWQGVDSTLTAGSQNLVTSGVVYSINEKIGKIEVLFNYEQHYYGVTAVGQTVTPSSPSSSNNYRCLISEISEGDSIFVSGKGGSSARLWAFLDSTYTVLAIAGINVTENNIEHIAPANSAYFIINDNNTGGKIYKQYKTSIDSIIKEFKSIYNEQVEYKEYTNFSIGIQYQGQYVGSYLTESTQSNSAYIRVPVSAGDSFILNSPYSSGIARTWYFVNHVTVNNEEKDLIIDFAKTGVEDANKLLITPEGANVLIVQCANNNRQSLIGLGSSPRIELINEDIVHLKNLSDKAMPNFKGFTRYLEASLAKIHFGNHFANVGLIGDSWTEGKYEGGYTKQLALILQEKYGYGGLGWLDLTRETAVGSSSLIYGAALEGTGYNVSLINESGITTLDGSTGTSVASQCLGPCCAHSVFANGSGVSLTFNEGVLDRFNILYYKNAHFTITVNGGMHVEITANSSDRLQYQSFHDDSGITSVVIVSAADDTVILGMDCFYGESGIRLHKFGNGSSKVEHFLAMNTNQFEDEMAYFNLDWVSLQFGLNDMIGIYDQNVAKTISENIASLGERVKNAYIVDEEQPKIDINILNVYAVISSSASSSKLLYKPQRENAINFGLGFLSTKYILGTPLDSSVFSDGVHLNRFGWYMIAKALEKTFFNF